MLAFLRDHGLTLALVLAAVGMVSGWTSSARYKGMADAEAAQVERLEADVQAAARRASAARARAAAAEEEADSASEAAARAEAETQRVREASAATIARLNTQLQTLESLDADLAAAIEAEAEANAGMISIESHRQRVAGLHRQIAVTDSLREAERLAKLQERERGDAQRDRADALEVHVGELQAQIGGLTEQVLAQGSQIDAQARQIEALEAASTGIFPDFGDLTTPVYLGIGALIGWGGAKLTQAEAR